MPVYFESGSAPIIIAVVNGVPAAMLFDTGSTTSFVSPQIAKQAHLPVLDMNYTLTFSGVGGDQTAELSSAHQFILGNAAASDMQIVIMRYDPGMDPHGQPNIMDGDLADDVTRNYDVDLDFPHGQLTFYTAGWCAHVAPPWTGAATAVPISIDDYGQIHIPVSIDGRKLTAFLDTGTTESDIPTDLFTSSGLARDGRLMSKNNIVRAIGGFGFIAEDEYQFQRLSIGGVTVRDPILNVENPDEELPDLPPAQRAKIERLIQAHEIVITGGTGPDITLGEDFILFHRIFISYSTHMLYIQN